jgi:hypothetical protein
MLAYTETISRNISNLINLIFSIQPKAKQNFQWDFNIFCVQYVMEQRTLKNVSNCLITTIYSYLETSGGQSSNLYLNVPHFFNF